MKLKALQSSMKTDFKEISEKCNRWSYILSAWRDSTELLRDVSSTSETNICHQTWGCFGNDNGGCQVERGVPAVTPESSDGLKTPPASALTYRPDGAARY